MGQRETLAILNAHKGKFFTPREIAVLQSDAPSTGSIGLSCRKLVKSQHIVRKDLPRNISAFGIPK